MNSDELFSLGLLGLLTLALISLIALIGIKVARSVERRRPENHFTNRLTLAGVSLYACMTCFLIVCAITRELRPESPFGQFLNRADGLIATLVAMLFVVAIAGTVLDKLGFPIMHNANLND